MSDDHVDPERLHTIADCDGRAGEPLGKALCLAADALDAYRRATGGLPLGLVAKLLNFARDWLHPDDGLTDAEEGAVETATFEVAE